MRERRVLHYLLLLGLLISAMTAGLSCSLWENRGTEGSDPAAKQTTESPGSAQTSSPAGKPTIASSKRAKPNVLLITIDTLRADALGCYGNPRVKTPNLDALARQGVRFSITIAQYTQTNPSHASIFTGTYPATHRLRSQGSDKLPPSPPTLAEVLGSNGYTTAGIYSWPCFDPEWGLGRGFAHYKAAYLKAPQEDKDWIRSFEGRADLTTDSALHWLREKPSAPFFLWVHYQDPHIPYSPPSPFDTMYDEPRCEECPDGGWDTHDRVMAGESFSDTEIAHLLALYHGEVSFADREIGRLLEEMSKASLMNDTVVIVTADHGEGFGENGGWWHPWVHYNTVLRVPLIMSYPAALPAGLVIDTVVRSIDIMPTILDLADVSLSRQIEGRSLLPIITGLEKADKTAAFAQGPFDASTTMVTGEWKLIRDNVKGKLELYNLKRDPEERNNLASADPQQASRLGQQLRAWMDSHGIKPEAFGFPRG
ncbi:MAG: sulfatase [Chloroflexota bacterium]